MFDDELIIGSIRTQSMRLKQLLYQIETDERWKDNSLYYLKEIQAVERSLRKIRKIDFEPIHRGYSISLNKH